MKIKRSFIVVLLVPVLIWIYFCFFRTDNEDKLIVKQCLNFFTVNYDLSFDDKYLKEKLVKFLSQSCYDEDIVKNSKYTFHINKNDSLLVFNRKNLLGYPKFELKLFPNDKNERCINKNLGTGFYSKNFKTINNVNHKEINQYLVKSLDSLISIPLFSANNNWKTYALFKYEDSITSISCYSNINRNLLNRTKEVIEQYISDNNVAFDYALIPIVAPSCPPDAASMGSR